MRGAGGTSGGIGKFCGGALMAITGLYMLLSSITVSNSFSLGHRLFAYGTAPFFNNGVPAGTLFIPLLIGIGFIFYNAKSWIGWLLAGGALGALIFGVFSTLSIHIQTMSLLNMMVIFVLLAGGTGLFLSSLRPQ